MNYLLRTKHQLSLKRVFLVLICSLLLLPIATSPHTIAAQPSTQLQVTFIDVGQGDSIFIKTSEGETALIDGGYDNGQALAYLQKQGIHQLTMVIASHPHADHIGGLVQVMEAMPVGEVWTSGASHTTGIYEGFLDVIAEKKIPYNEALLDSVIPFGSLKFNVLFTSRKATNLNNTSLVLHLKYGEVSFLFTGDAESEVEAQLVSTAKAELRSTVLKVGHHGSYTSSTPAFLEVVHPEIAVYSAGRGNSYGHPHKETIDNLTTAGATIYGTDVQGTMTILTDGKQYIIQTENDVAAIQGKAGALAIKVVKPVPTVAQNTLTNGAKPNIPLKYDPAGPDRDCGNFSTHAEAQAFFIAAGGPTKDRHRLDGDHDGIACEALP